VISWWSILGISENSNSVKVKEAYQILAKRYHPDNLSTGNAEKFIQVKSAYDQAMKSFI
jgi:DnaJ-class molecular chaperone